MTVIQRKEKTVAAADPAIQRAQTEAEFVGKAWKNVSKSKKNEGTEFFRLTFDRDIASLSLDPAIHSLVLWPNNKREGKNDADYRVMLTKRG